jgi:hypothetical protein
MYRQLLRSTVLASLAGLIAIPAFAQIYADLGPVHIRIANQAPPPVRYEQRPAQPYPDAVWLNGSWHWQENRWDWTSGRWEQPVSHSAHWVNARYAREGCPWYHHQGCGWRYEPAHWSTQQLVEGEDYQEWKHQHHSGGDQHSH